MVPWSFYEDDLHVRDQVSILDVNLLQGFFQYACSSVEFLLHIAQVNLYLAKT